MRRVALLCIATVFVACAKTENKPADTGMAAVAPEPAPAPPAAAPVSLKDVAGKYAVTGKNEAGDSTLVTYEINAMPDTTGWTLVFPNRKPEPLRVIAVAGDSVVVEAGPYESVLRKGVKVTTHSVYRFANGQVTGRTVAHYATKSPDSVRIVVAEGVRK